MPQPRKPTALRIIEGNREKRPLPKKEPKPRRGIPQPPPHLVGYALEEWERITPELYMSGVLTMIDGAVLAAYCQAYARWREAEDAILRMKQRDKLTAALMIKTKNGNAIQNPLVGVANRSMMLMQRFANEFGMTPAARARLEVDLHDNGEAPSKADTYF
ncbi:phage terminase small subunit P27 family [Paraburkholderia terrae]|uniref:Phage terminase small subunit P27 family n=1 Tax=Paraburkholderia terrae TaxID=311230 RepID=A0A2I8ETS0_9BURK|nr:phage terminase small subunit P27 family [Paraburkholderia terrae]AUT62890.1 phage terminase small subunit P27 family [Paraburkholderia terrae]